MTRNFSQTRNRALLLTGLGAALLVAIFLSPFASQAPDGLDRVSKDLKFEDKVPKEDLALELCDRTVVLSQGQVVYDGETERVMGNQEFLVQHALELPLSYSRPYCQLEDAPAAIALTR